MKILYLSRGITCGEILNTEYRWVLVSTYGKGLLKNGQEFFNDTVYLLAVLLSNIINFFGTTKDCEYIALADKSIRSRMEVS